MVNQELERLHTGDVVQHFKRETLTNPGCQYLYQILEFAQHTETGEKMVVYKALYRNDQMGVNYGIYVRPYDMFMSEVDRAKYPDIKQQYRFERYYV